MILRIKQCNGIKLKIDDQLVLIKINKIIYCMYLGSMNVAIAYDDRYIIMKNSTLKKFFIFSKEINTRFDDNQRQKKLLLKILYD